jgi:hypothetical protein
MKNTIYNHYKEQLINEAKEVKKQNKRDKALCRYVINNKVDDIIRGFEWHEMKEKISTKQKELYSEWIVNLACKLHP